MFQVTGLDKDGRYFMSGASHFRRRIPRVTLMPSYREPCPAKAGDYWEFFAEIDVLCALSACPGGDLSAWGWGEGTEGSETDMLSCCRPLAVEVYSLLNEDSVLKDWRGPERAAYAGFHGLSQPTFPTEK